MHSLYPVVVLECVMSRRKYTECACITYITFDLSCSQYYRARYESEGYRGPLKGQHECYPSVRVNGCTINCI